MKIAAISDLHGILVELKYPVDVLFICGDVVPLEIQRNIPKSLKWIKKTFIPWAERLPAERVIMVAGNHDFVMEKSPSEIKNSFIGTKITILYDEGTTYIDKDARIFNIWGSPLCHQFGNWAFMNSNEYNKEQYEKMPNNIDILITHDAAYMHSDQCLGFYDAASRELHRGNIPLQEVVEKKQPKLHLFGHLHTCAHSLIDYAGTLTACVSIVDENYTLTYLPLYLDL